MNIHVYLDMNNMLSMQSTSLIPRLSCPAFLQEPGNEASLARPPHFPSEVRRARETRTRLDSIMNSTGKESRGLTSCSGVSCVCDCQY